MDRRIFTELAGVLAWPLVVGIFLFGFRKSLATFLDRLAGRVTKLSVFNVSIELAALPAPPLAWSDENIQQNSELAGGEVYSTAITELFGRIGVTTPWDYLMVDIKDGHFWLVSRVFIFTVFLQAMRGVKSVAFVASQGEHHRQFIGLASPDTVRATLSGEYSWLDPAVKCHVQEQNYVPAPITFFNHRR